MISPEPTSRGSAPAEWLWVALIAVASIALSRAFACATPFAALATLAAFTLAGRQAVALVLFVWIANQAIGFGLMRYPWTASTMTWGVAIGVAAMSGLAIARELARRTLSSLWAVPLGLVAAFAVYQGVLFATALLLASGTGAFEPKVIMRIFAINATAMALLIGARGAATITARGGLLPWTTENLGVRQDRADV